MFSNERIVIPEIHNSEENGVNVTLDSEEKVSEPTFDQKETFNQELRPLIEKLIGVCQNGKIPFICAVNFSNDSDGSGVCFVSGLPGARTPMQFRLITDIMQDSNGKLFRGAMVGIAAAHAIAPDTNGKEPPETH